MTILKETTAYKCLMKTFRAIKHESSLNEGFILKLLELKDTPNSKKILNRLSKNDVELKLTYDEIVMEYRIYRSILMDIMGSWEIFSKDLDIHLKTIESNLHQNVELHKDLKRVIATIDELKSSINRDERHRKKVWTIEEAAQELGIQKKSLQTKISKWKKEGKKLPWLIEQKGSYNRIKVKEFLEWIHGHKTAGRPIKQLK